jgi:hypothetical protein
VEALVDLRPLVVDLARLEVLGAVQRPAAVILGLELLSLVAVAAADGVVRGELQLSLAELVLFPTLSCDSRVGWGWGVWGYKFTPRWISR